jgi:hypothetical protein
VRLEKLNPELLKTAPPTDTPPQTHPTPAEKPSPPAANEPKSQLENSTPLNEFTPDESGLTRPDHAAVRSIVAPNREKFGWTKPFTATRPRNLPESRLSRLDAAVSEGERQIIESGFAAIRFFKALELAFPRLRIILLHGEGIPFENIVSKEHPEVLLINANAYHAPPALFGHAFLESLSIIRPDLYGRVLDTARNNMPGLERLKGVEKGSVLEFRISPSVESV